MSIKKNLQATKIKCNGKFANKADIQFYVSLIHHIHFIVTYSSRKSRQVKSSWLFNLVFLLNSEAIAITIFILLPPPPLLQPSENINDLIQECILQ